MAVHETDDVTATRSIKRLLEKWVQTEYLFYAYTVFVFSIALFPSSNYLCDFSLICYGIIPYSGSESIPSLRSLSLSERLNKGKRSYM
jgi:hypothetical protein